MQGVKNFFIKNRVWFLSFVAFVVYDCVFIIGGLYKEVNDTIYEFHAVDFSLGFCSKLLPGAIYHLLVGQYNKTAMTIYIRVLTLLLMFLVCYLLQRFFNAFPDMKTSTKAIFLILFLTGPYTFYFLLETEGWLDLYWMLFFIVGLLMLNNKVTRWFVPMVFPLMVMVHFGAVICYAPLLGLIILLKYANAENDYDKKSYLTIFILAVLLTGTTFLYFSLFDTTNIALSSPEELEKYFEKRNVDFSYYFRYQFFHDGDGYGTPEEFFPSYMLTDSESKIIQFLCFFLQRIYLTFKLASPETYENAIDIIVFIIPLSILFLHEIQGYKKYYAKTILKKFMAVCFFILPILCLISIFVFSDDIIRWIDHSVNCLLVGFMALCIIGERKLVCQFEKKLEKVPMWCAIPYAACCAFALVG